MLKRDLREDIISHWDIHSFWIPLWGRVYALCKSNTLPTALCLLFTPHPPLSPTSLTSQTNSPLDHRLPQAAKVVALNCKCCKISWHVEARTGPDCSIWRQKVLFFIYKVQTPKQKQGQNWLTRLGNKTETGARQERETETEEEQWEVKQAEKNREGRAEGWEGCTELHQDKTTASRSQTMIRQGPSEEETYTQGSRGDEWDQCR